MYMFEKDLIYPWAYWDNTFTPEQCQKIIEIGNNLPITAGSVNSTRDIIDNYRKNKVSWIYHDESTEWIYERIAYVIKSLNQEFFNFHLYGIDKLQFTIYNSLGDFYKPHLDSGIGIDVRKLSFVIQLSDPNTYEGSNLEIYNTETGQIVNKNQGTLVAFPSYTLHEVTPIISGTRYSLVGWVLGKPFK